MQVKLATYYEEGQGVPRDSEEAVRLYRMAAERCEHVDAMMHLARCFLDGVGVRPSVAMAAWWHQQAASAVCPSLRHPPLSLLRGAARGKRCVCVWSNEIAV